MHEFAVAEPPLAASVSELSAASSVVRKRLTQKTGGADPFDSGWGASSTSVDPTWPQCILCEQPVAPGEQRFFQQGYVHAKECHANIRACRLAHQKDMETLDALDTLLIDDRAAWRAKVAQFGENRVEARKKVSAEIATRKKTRSIAEVDSTRRESDWHEMDEDEYVTYWLTINRFRSVDDLRQEFAERIRGEGQVASSGDATSPILGFWGKEWSRQSRGWDQKKSALHSEEVSEDVFKETVSHMRRGQSSMSLSAPVPPSPAKRLAIAPPALRTSPGEQRLAPPRAQEPAGEPPIPPQSDDGSTAGGPVSKGKHALVLKKVEKLQFSAGISGKEFCLVKEILREAPLTKIKSMSGSSGFIYLFA